MIKHSLFWERDFMVKCDFCSNPKLPKNKHIGETLRRPMHTLRRKVITNKTPLHFSLAPCSDMELLGGKDTYNAFRECDSISLEPLCFVLLIATNSLWVWWHCWSLNQSDVLEYIKLCVMFAPRQGQYVGSWVIRGESEAGRPPGAPMGGYQPSRGPPYPNQSAHGPNEAVKVLPV